ncbi:MAG: DPP IV N-terminal domain-containing protein, partial [Candidatus Wallbacteria bacterium]|nr:DPP IV N-terminal domain-containing protein [Candidatus Wallbacteria bacterium]
MALVKRRLFIIFLTILCISSSLFFMTACGGGGGGGGGAADGTTPVTPVNVPLFRSVQSVNETGGSLTLPDNSSLQIQGGLFKGSASISTEKYSAPQTRSDDYTTVSGSCYVLTIPSGTVTDQPGKFFILKPAAALAPQKSSGLTDTVNRYIIGDSKYFGICGDFRVDSDSLQRSGDIRIEMLAETSPASINLTQGLNYISGRNGPFLPAVEYVSIKTPLILLCGWPEVSKDPGTLYFQQFQSFINSFYADSNLTAAYELFSFSYDSARTLAEIAGDFSLSGLSLRTEIERVFPLGRKVVLLGYSCGGLIGHHYIQKCGGDLRVCGFIGMGVPFHGLPVKQWTGTGHLTDVLSASCTIGISASCGYDFFDDTFNQDPLVQKLLTTSSPDSLRNCDLYDLNRNLKSLDLYHCLAGTSVQSSYADATGDGLVPLESALLKSFNSGSYGDNLQDFQVFPGISNSALITDTSVISRARVMLAGMIQAPASPNFLISFVSDRTGVNDIYLMKMDGSGLTNLTGDDWYDTAPDFNTDASKIAFHSHSEIYTMDINGFSSSNKVNLTNNTTADWDPVWTPDGSKIIFASTRTGHWEIFRMPSTGGTVTQLTNTGNWVENRCPAVSPDGNKIIFSSNQNGGNYDIYRMTMSGGLVTRLTSDTAFDSYPEYSAGGGFIVFSSGRGSSDAINVWKMNADGTNPVRLTNAANYVCQDPTVSPDNTKVVFDSNQYGNFDLFSMNCSDGSELTRITSGPGDNFHPSVGWSGSPLYLLTVNITPQGAIDAKAGWSIDEGTTWNQSGDSLCLPGNSNYKITFQDLEGFLTPAEINGNIGTAVK